MNHYRLNLFIQPEHAKRLDELAAKKGVSKSSIVAAALASWLSPDAADQREAAIASGWIAFARQAERMERDQNIAIETLALFIRYYLTVSTPVPEAHQDAARAQGKARFEQFTEQLGRHLLRGPQPGARRGGGTASRPDADGRRGGSRASAGARVMSARVPIEGQSMTATSLDRRIQMLRTAMGPLIAAALEDPDVWR
ncbi:Uncharacterised protein [Klebsiella pneumoniae]|uniref:Uncharacterized protein n=1 Tax=Klebsiella pneumoniae TaxID=573 RepID=A0A378A405_KLEPN|nr:Uncharacterised protein [Klebsiella pneumoniae]